jgi:radical SAM protein with 4Fe4S-binding SPASM domain
VSIDGLETTHDAVRGLAGSFASALAALDHLRRAGLEVAVNTQIHRANAGEIAELTDLVVRERAFGWQVALTVPMGRAADDPTLFLQPYELLELFPVLAREALRARAAGVRLVRGNDVGYFGPFEEIFEPQYPEGYACGCGAGREILGVEADGTIKGCPSLASEAWIGGSVRDHRLRDVWERGLTLQALRGPRETKLWGYCARCYYAAECGGGCTWMADSLFQRPGNNPYCHHRALELAKEGLRERVVRLQPPPGRSFDRGLFELVVEKVEPASGRT